MRYLVTGGGGFLGKGIIKRLIEEGHQVSTINRGYYPSLYEMGVACLQGDISDPAMVLKAAQGCDGVFHVAAKAGVWGSYKVYHQINVMGTENVLKACQKLGIPNLVYTGSPSSTFAGDDQLGVDESEPTPQKFLAHYPRTKAMAEELVLSANTPLLKTVSLRPHLIWGPGDNHLVPRLVQRARSGRLRLIGREDKLVDSTYIDNAVDAHVLAMEKLEFGELAGGKAYFISNNEPLPIGYLVNGFLAAAKIAPVEKRISAGLAYGIGAVLEGAYGLARVKKEPPMTRFVAKQLSTAHWYNLDAAMQDLGYVPRVSVKEGLKRLARDPELATL